MSVIVIVIGPRAFVFPHRVPIACRGLTGSHKKNVQTFVSVYTF